MPKDFNFDLKEYPEARISKILELGELSDKDLREKANKRLFCKLDVSMREQSYLIPKIGSVTVRLVESCDDEAWNDFKQIADNLYKGRGTRIATLRLLNQLSSAF